MKYFVIIGFNLLCIFFIFNELLIGQDYPVRSGSIIFIEAKCNKCHSINSQAIECTSTKTFACDLSKVGDSINVEIIKDYLKKKVKLNSKKHPVAFNGKATDFDILCNWLQNLTSAVF